jgi:competence protein ComEC
MLNIYLNYKVNRKINSYMLHVRLKLFRKSIKISLSKKNIKEILILLNIFASIYITGSYLYRTYFENYIYYFNVKQGNMAFIRYNRKNIVIDMGSETKDLAGNVLNTFLKAKAIDTIDYIILSHMHTDHINGLAAIAEKINIKNICYGCPKDENTTILNEIKNIDSVAKLHSISTIQLEESDEIQLDKNLKLDILSPPRYSKIKSSDMQNSNSLDVLLLVKDNNYLFMGDATKETEQSLMNKINNLNVEFKNIEVLQVGHHGSKTSTCQKFLKKVNFKEAVISSEKKKYGHPDKVTLDLLKKYNVEIRTVENEGAIRYNLKY